MKQRLRELLASGLVALAVLIVLWWVLRKMIGMILWLANLTILAAAVILLLVVASRLRRPTQRRSARRRF